VDSHLNILGSSGPVHIRPKAIKNLIKALSTTLRGIIGGSEGPLGPERSLEAVPTNGSSEEGGTPSEGT
jgi:hypothetical protein